MAFVPGVRLGPYEIIAAIGAGGMGEVYRGRDPRLGRDVAIKVLPTAVSSDPDRLHRFEQEARAAAALNHPNILAVFDIGRHNGVPYIVSELLEGETLRERLSAGALPVRSAIDLAVQIAHGLAAAHEKGIIHRDLKPGNVFVTADDRVKILDFGLAKLVAAEQAAAGASLVTTAAADTAPGIVLGTVGYMAPEQVRGAPVDRRTDIFALGVILYELISGQRPFARDTVPETMTAILREDVPDLHTRAPQVPLPLGHVIRRCLDKDPSRRFQSTQDLAFALETVGTPSTSAVAPAPTSAPRTHRKRIAAAAVVIALTAIGATAAILLRPSAVPRPLRRVSISLSDAAPLAPAGVMPLGLGKTSIAISPDGTRVVYVASRNGTRHLVVRDLGSFELRPLRGTDGAVAPFFSPDGNAIGFFSENALKTVSLSGGDPVTVTEARQARGGVWLADGSIVFGNFEGAQLVQVPRSGAPRIVANSSYSFQSMAALPQNRAVLTDIRSGPNPDFNTVEAVSLADGGRKVLVRSGTHPFYRDGRLFFLRSGSLYAVRFDPVTLVVTGSPVAILDGIRTETQGAGQVALSEEGTLVYVEGATAWQGTPVWVTRDGMAQRGWSPRTRVWHVCALPRWAQGGV